MGKRLATKKKTGQKSINIAKLPVQFDPALKMLWVDRMDILVRTDGTVSLRFSALYGEHLVEACRLQATAAHAKQIAEVISRSLSNAMSIPASQENKEK